MIKSADMPAYWCYFFLPYNLAVMLS